MDHVAIMNKSWKLIPKILEKKKTIESRWYIHKRAPWNKIESNDTIYFKDTGEPITAKAEVQNVLQFENYTEDQLRNIINTYHHQIQFVSSNEEVFNWAKTKKYCILIFLKNPTSITPVQIDKTGFGNACAWMCVGDIKRIKNIRI